MKYLLMALLLTGSLCAGAQTIATSTTNPYPRTITVTGSAEMSVTPDQLFVSVRLREYNRKGDGKQPLEKLRAHFLEACRASGIADSLITIVSYSGAGNSWMWRKYQKQPDLMASVTYELKLRSSSQIDSLADRLDDAATESFGISRLAHSRETEFRRQLKIDAIRAARTKANYLAESIDEKVGVAITIREPEENGWGAGGMSNMLTNYSSNSVSRGNTYSESSDTDGGAQPTALQKVRYRYEVTVVFSLK